MRVPKARVVASAALLVLVGFARSPESLGDTLLDDTRHAFPATHKWFGMVADLQIDQNANSELVPVFSSLRSSLVRNSDGAGQSLSPRLPARADGAHTIALDGAPGFWVRTRELDAQPVRAQLASGVVVYPAAIAGGDLMYKLTPTHVDEYLYLAAPPPSLLRRASVELGPAVLELREASGRVEAVDAQGTARLRVSAPFARAADGTRRQGTIHLQAGVLVSELDLQGLLPPLLVDPDWSTTGTMTVGHWSDAAFLRPDGKVMVVAGCALTGCPSSYAQSGCGQVLADTEVWTQSTGTWTAGPPLQTARYAFSSTQLADGDVLVAGGCTVPGCTEQTASAERFDRTLGQWQPAGTLASARANSATALLRDGRVLVIGGCAGSSCVATVDRYDPTKQTWDAAAALPTARGFGVATLLTDGRVLLSGGCTDSACATQLRDALLYDPSSNTWSAAGLMSSVRAGHTATLIGDGRVLVVGGCADAACKVTLPSVELWSAANGGGSFSAGPTIPGARHNHTATLLDTGEVLIAGGASGASSSLPNATAYVPSLDRWLDVEPMNMDRAYHVAVLLPSHDVMLGGGCNLTTCMPWCELFSPKRLPMLESAPPPLQSDGGVASTTDAATSGGAAGTLAGSAGGSASGGGSGRSGGTQQTTGDGGVSTSQAKPTTPHPARYRSGAAKCATDDMQELACPQTGWPWQDADFQPNARVLSQSAADEVSDPSTHLLWQRDDDGKTYDHEQASAHCAQLVSKRGKQGSWRLPSVVELMTLTDYGRNTPSIDPIFTHTQPNNYWTSTPVASGTTQSWTVKLDFGEVIPVGAAKLLNVKCVRDEGDSLFGPDRLRQAGSLVADGAVVRDEQTGLEWQRKDDGVRRSWQDSLAYCAGLSLAGKDDWHLPNAFELRGLIEYGQAKTAGPVIDPVFQAPKPDIYWTATPNDGIPTLSWSVSFNLGVVDGVTVSGITYARCVRHIASTGSNSSHHPASGCSCRIARGSRPRDTVFGLGLSSALLLAAALRLRSRRRNAAAPHR
ncbi:MAG TPA: DUF1566 domain-containing protein [Polyangiales bacterium]